MGNVVIPIRGGVAIGPSNVAHVIGCAFQKAIRELPRRGVHIPSQNARRILLNIIVECATRGMRDSDQLCETAVAQLCGDEEKEWGRK